MKMPPFLPPGLAGSGDRGLRRTGPLATFMPVQGHGLSASVVVPRSGGREAQGNGLLNRHTG